MHEDMRIRLARAGFVVGDDRLNAAAAFAALRSREGDDATLDDRLALEAVALGVRPAELTAADTRRAMEDFYGHRWAGFEIVGGEERNDDIDVAEYDPAWPAVFAAWRRRIRLELGGVAVRVEHVGSTAVPGLVAKPIVDIQISVHDLDDESTYVPGLRTVGVSLRSRDAEHRYFRPPPERPRDVHVHVCRVGGTWEHEHILFRDYLIAHDDARTEYAALKRDLARRFATDRLAYTEGKTAFIVAAMQAAERWVAEAG